jgi:hypothetical protein
MYRSINSKKSRKTLDNSSVLNIRLVNRETYALKLGHNGFHIKTQILQVLKINLLMFL